ncbi:hypothetical protein ACP8HI_01430 [Paenibacillus sp. FA6]|uniref:hypothetical protein n=1 Tax=Paenibacillus sp. FA6 TaxID=3413029 RepID=UPI003F65C95F
MKQFSVALQETRRWFETLKWYSFFREFELQLLFGGLGIMFLRDLVYQLLPNKFNNIFYFVFQTIPLNSLAYLAFLVGAWLTLVSRNNLKYLPYGLWGYALYVLFPFTSISLSSLITPLVYILLGYGVFKYSVTSYATELEG